MQRKIFFFVFFFLSVLVFIQAETVFAQTTPPPANPTGGLQYTLLEQIPGAGSTWSGDLPTYLKALYTFTFWTIGIAALFMLSVGGFMYVTSAGNTSRMGTAKEIIFDSILGLCLALVAWLFLYVINPAFTEIRLPALTVTPTGAPVAPVTTPTTPLPVTPPATPPSPGTVQDLAKQVLAPGSGIALSGSGTCNLNASTAVTPLLNINQIASTGKMNRCQNGCSATSFCSGETPMSSQLLQVMLDVAKVMPYTVNSIAGGSHCSAVNVPPGCKGESRHYRGEAIDVGPVSQALLTEFRNKGAFGSFCDTNGSAVACSAATHIHVQF